MIRPALSHRSRKLQPGAPVDGAPRPGDTRRGRERDGSYSIRSHASTVACRPTAGEENQGNGGDSFGPTVAERLNLAAGENFNDTVTFSPVAGRSYRLCGLLGDYNQNGDRPPDARAEALICAEGTTLRDNACVSGSGGGGGGDNGIEVVPGSSGGCASNGRFTGISANRVDCSDAQRIERSWSRSRSCRPSRARPRRTCTVLGFRCVGTRSSRTGRISVRCARSSTDQAVRFRYRP